MGCPVKITASYDKVQRKLKVNHCVLEHSHRTSKDIIKHYPFERKLAKDQESDICDLLALQPNNKLVLNMIEKKFGKHMTLRDLHNLKAKVKHNGTRGRKDAENTLCFLTDILQSNNED